MPELPEVETIVRDLKKKVIGRVFIDVWTDFEKMIRVSAALGRKERGSQFQKFKKYLKGKTIKDIERRGKNILINLSQGKTLLIHQKLTGHLLFGRWEQKEGRWQSKIAGPLADDPKNRFLHMVFFFKDDSQLALSDLRKFAKVELWDKKELENSKGFKGLGPEPLEKNFTFENFQKIIKKKRAKIKQVLMDQNVIAGIGNIYSDEILWRARVHPLKEISKLSIKELKDIFFAIKELLPKAIRLGGESMSDFRTLSGEKGLFDGERKVYRKEGEKCPRCPGKIKRIKIGSRSAHFCPNCQK